MKLLVQHLPFTHLIISAPLQFLRCLLFSLTSVPFTPVALNFWEQRDFVKATTKIAIVNQ
jgi:hypothetical protein